MEKIVTSLGRRVGPLLQSAGVSLEKTGISLGVSRVLPAYAAYCPLENDVSVQAQLHIQKEKSKELVSVPDRFVAPSASVASPSSLSTGSSVWYFASVSQDGVKLGEDTCVMEHASIEGSSSKATVIGRQSIVQPRALVKPGCKIGDRSVIGSGAILEEGVTVESEAIVAQGSRVVSGTVVRARELWAGNPAVKVRELEPKEVSQTAESASETLKLALLHATEHNKPEVDKYLERYAFEDRINWVEDIVEHAQATGEPVYVNLDVLRDPNPEQRGLLFDKGQDKGGN